MRIVSGGCVVMMSAILCVGSAMAGEVDLSRVRVIRAKDENPQQKRAADELVKHLQMIAGTKVGEEGLTFLFGCPKGERSFPYTALAKREGNTIYFWGDDVGMKRYPFYGSAFAVYGFLENVLGVKWVVPGDDGIVFTPRMKVDIPDDWTYEYKYRAQTALIRAVDKDFGLRMRYAEKRPFVYGHAYTTYQRRYLKEHPEWFGLGVDGSRGVQEKWAHFAKLCDTNPEVVEQIVNEWKGRGAPLYFNVCVNDGAPGYCYCENCRAYDYYAPGEPFFFNNTDRHLAFYNRIAAKAREIRPDVKCIAYLYGYYQFPPRREIVEYPDNMLFGIVPSGTFEMAVKSFAGFEKAGVKNFFFRPNYMCAGGELPHGVQKFLYDTFHFYHKKGAVGYDYDGGRATIEELALSYYVVFRQCAFPDLTFEEILDEFMSQYGAAADVAAKYFARIRERTERVMNREASWGTVEQVDIADDFVFMDSPVRIHTVRDLMEDVRVLETADLALLSPVEKRRFEKLIARAKGYVTAYPEVRQRTLKLVGPSRRWEAEKRLMGSRPPVKEDETVDLAQEGHCAFVELSAAERYQKLVDSDCRKKMRLVGTRPHPVTFAWPFKGKADVTIVRERDDKTVFSVSANCPIAVYNLDIGERYSWSAMKDGCLVGKGLFGTSARGPRWIGVPDAPKIANMRDFGGWMKGIGGRKIRQGFLYRSNALDDCMPTERSRVTSVNAREFLMGRLGLKTDVDLRAAAEVGSRKSSPLCGANWVHAPIPTDADVVSAAFRKSFAKLFAVLTEEKNYPIVIHGADGANRTGVVAALLQGLLGVSEEKARIDWELSAFYSPTIEAEGFDRLMASIGGKTDESFTEKAEAYAHSCGIDSSAIGKFRILLLDDSQIPVRPAGVNGQVFWNGHAEWFVFPPSFDFKAVEGAVKYRFEVIDDQHRVRSFESHSPNASLEPVWGGVPVGFASVTCLGLDANGKVIGRAGSRHRFWRQAPFRNGSYPKAKRPYSDAAALAFDYVFSRSSTRHLAMTGEMDFTYSRNAYPSKMGGAVIEGMVKYAKLRPDCAEDALSVARKQADWLIAHSETKGMPLADFPPTYSGDRLTAKQYAGEIMLMYPATAAIAYLDLYEVTKSSDLLDAAVRVGKRFLALQGKDGTWWLKMRVSDGEPIGKNRCNPLAQIRLFERLFAITGDEVWRKSADKAFSFIDKGPLSTWNWEGQFEDVPPSDMFVNLTGVDPNLTAQYLLLRFPNDVRRREQAWELSRFVEDQFICWERPSRTNGLGPRYTGFEKLWVQNDYCDWAVPGVCEQYHCYHLIDSSAALCIKTWLLLYRMTSDPVLLAKARALGDAIVNVQDPDGRIPTHWNRSKFKDHDYDWVNCIIESANALTELAKYGADD